MKKLEKELKHQELYKVHFLLNQRHTYSTACYLMKMKLLSTSPLSDAFGCICVFLKKMAVICVPERAVPDEAAEVQRAAARPHQVEPRHRGRCGAAAAGPQEGDPSRHGRVRFR